MATSTFSLSPVGWTVITMRDTAIVDHPPKKKFAPEKSGIINYGDRDE